VGRKLVTVTAEQLGDAWPLVVDSVGVRRCYGACLVVEHNGVSYALNGLATTKGFKEIEPIWKWNPLKPGCRMDIGPLLGLVRKVC
jgi:hypothetical protein